MAELPKTQEWKIPKYLRPRINIILADLMPDTICDLVEMLRVAAAHCTPVTINWEHDDPDCGTCIHWDGDHDNTCPHKAATGECEYESTD